MTGSQQARSAFRLSRWVLSAPAMMLAVLGWAAGCATGPRPLMDPGYAAQAWAPSRVAVMPPDVFVVVDEVGDNDPAQAAALGQQVTATAGKAIDQALRARGYDVDFSAGWGGIVAQDGNVLVSREELGGLANGILSFANSPEAGGEGGLPSPRLVEPELAARVGWATQSDAVLYVNVKGAVTTPGKRTASVFAAVFIVVIIAAVILAIAASSKGGGGHGSSAPSSGGGGWRGAPVARAAPAGGGWRGAPSAAPRMPAPRAAAVAPIGASRGWRAGTGPSVAPRGAPVYRGGGGGIGIGIGVVVPINGPVYTHDGTVGYDDPMFAGDELYVSMTMISTYDGRVLWHARENLDLEADRPEDIERMVQIFLGTLPPARPPVSPGPSAPAAAPPAVTPPPAAPPPPPGS